MEGASCSLHGSNSAHAHEDAAAIRRADRRGLPRAEAGGHDRTTRRCRKSASSTARERRLLRVGIVHGRRIVEERLLARTGDVTIGTSPRSTFIVPWDDVPLRWRLFEERGGRRFLHLAGGMTARIAEGAAMTSIDGGAGSRAADPAVGPGARQGDHRRHDRAVPAAAPARAAAAAPAADLRSPPGHRGIDRFFAGVVAFTLLLHVVLVVYLRQVDWPRRPDIEAIPDRFIHQIVRVPRPARRPPRR